MSFLDESKAIGAIGRRIGCAAAVIVAVMMIVSAAQAGPMFSIALKSHPNGNVSADPNAVDARDYGLRLDDGNWQTFDFTDVTMTFHQPVGPIGSSTVYATISGVITHLQSSDDGSLGYSATSGLDVEDQQWSIDATFRQIGSQGDAFGLGDLPAGNMLQTLIDEGIGNDAITFDSFDLALTPLFDEGSEAAIYGGPRTFVEKWPASGAPFLLEYRHRLSVGTFASPDWDVITGNGWVMPTNKGGSSFTRDFLFYSPQVPEPSTTALVLLGGIALLRQRRANR